MFCVSFSEEMASGSVAHLQWNLDFTILDLTISSILR